MLTKKEQRRIEKKVDYSNWIIWILSIIFGLIMFLISLAFDIARHS